MRPRAQLVTDILGGIGLAVLGIAAIVLWTVIGGTP
jgi:hypothetical protein